MADMMNSHLEYIFGALLLTECFAGFLVNVTILVAIFLKWKTLRSLQIYYKILSCLLMSRSLYYLSTFYMYFISVFYTWVYRDIIILAAVNAQIMLLYYSNVWFATVLCVFYCVKITSYNWKVLIFLKTKISSVVSWFLLVSLLLAVSSSLLFGFYFYDFEAKNVTHCIMENMTACYEGPTMNLQKQYLILFLGACPFLTICVSNCLLLHSLWMHTRRMRSSGSGFRTPNLESHISAVKSTSLFLFLQIIYFIVMNVMLSGRLLHYKAWRLFSLIITRSALLIHSLYIISSNSELRKAYISMCHAFTRVVHC